MEPGTQRSDAFVWIVVAVVVVAMVVAGLFFMGSWTGGGMMGGGTAAWGWGLPMLVVGILVVVALVLLLARGPETGPAPAYYYPPAAPAPPQGTAVQILEARYARGEITRDEYLRMRQDLEPPRT